MVERLVKVHPAPAHLAVRCTWNRREFREHYARAALVSKSHGRFDFLLIGLGMPHDEICGDCGRVHSGRSQMANGTNKIIRIYLAPRAILPIVRIALEAEIERSEPSVHH